MEQGDNGTDIPPWWPDGYYEGDVVTKWNSDGRTMTVMQNYAYIGPDRVRWDAPQGSIVDGASIPRVLWSLIGGPFEGLYRDASVVHDVACVNRMRHWRDAHRAFYTAMLKSGVDLVRAKVMYGAVFHFGPRWAVAVEPKIPGTLGMVIMEPPPAPTLKESDFPELVEEIEFSYRVMGYSGNAMTLDEIESFTPGSGLLQEIRGRESQKKTEPSSD
jgi:hypothetical protein